MAHYCLLVPLIATCRPIVFVLDIYLFLHTELSLDQEVNEILSLPLSAEALVLIQHSLLYIVEKVLEALLLPSGEHQEVGLNGLQSQVSLLVELVNIDLYVCIFAHVEHLGRFLACDDDA